MVVKLSGHVRNTISLLYKQKTRAKFRYLELFLEKKLFFFSILVYFHWKSAWVRPCLKTSLWRHTLTDFHVFGINRKRRPYPIPWYQTIVLWARQFQVHKGVVTTPFGKPCCKNRLGRTRVKPATCVLKCNECVFLFGQRTLKLRSVTSLSKIIVQVYLQLKYWTWW